MHYLRILNSHGMLQMTWLRQGKHKDSIMTIHTVLQAGRHIEEEVVVVRCMS